MPLKKYFKEGQKISLHAISGKEDTQKIDAITCYLKIQGQGYVDLTLPYGSNPDENYPFYPETKYEILSDAMGVGVRLTGHFEKYLKSDLIRVRHNSDLQLIHRRVEDRRQEILELGYTKGKGKLRSFKQQWKKNTKILENIDTTANLPKFPQVNVNISMTGVGFKIKTPIEIADLCLLYINLNDGKPPVCTMTEVVWRAEEEKDGRCMAGFQYLNILEADRKRIQRFIKEKSRKKDRNNG